MWVKFSDGKVRYQAARPDNGYSVRGWDYGPDQVIVEFFSGNTHYFVRAFYKGDRPDWDVTKCTGKSYRNMTCR